MVSSVPRKALILCFKLFVNALRPANEAHRCEPIAPLVNGGLGGGGDCRMLREAEIIIGAQV